MQHSVRAIPCEGCLALLPPIDGPTHRYIGASPACWAIYSALVNGGEPPLVPHEFNALLVDAYAAQHPGTPSPQATQSVAVHLLALHGVFAAGQPPARALWLRQRALREGFGPRHDRFRWLTPPSFAGSPSVADVAAAPDPAARTARLRAYVEEVWARWAAPHGATLGEWYERYVIAEPR